MHASSSDEAEWSWRVIFAMGLALWAIGFADISLAFIPPRFGQPDWEFGTISAMLNSLPVPTVGLGLSFAAALALGRTKFVALSAAWCALLVLALFGAGVIYLLDVPLAMKALPSGPQRQALLAAIAKAAMAFVVYGTLHLFFLIRAARFLQRTPKVARTAKIHHEPTQ